MLVRSVFLFNFLFAMITSKDFIKHYRSVEKILIAINLFRKKAFICKTHRCKLSKIEAA